MKRLAAFLREHDDYLILTHARPDGDTLGSGAGLCALLRTLGKRAYVAPNPEVTPRYAGYVTPYYPPEGYAHQTVLTVDTASRILLPQCYRDMTVHYRIDHHANADEGYAENNYCSDHAACGEVVCELAGVLGVTLTREIAEPLYLAISTDTACFRHANTNARTHRIAATLMDTGMDRFAIDEKVFFSRSRARVAVESAVTRDMCFLAGERIAVATLPLSLRQETGAEEDDLESVSSLPRSIEGVMVGITIREEAEGCKLSLRTAAPYAANRICAVFGGGGHDRAAGAHTDVGIDASRELVLAALCRLYPEFGG